jgi:hypothetical protein
MKPIKLLVILVISHVALATAQADIVFFSDRALFNAAAGPLRGPSEVLRVSRDHILKENR